VLQLSQRLGVDLPDVLAHRELLADLLQSMVLVHPDAEAHAEDAFFAWRQRRQTRVSVSRRFDWMAASMGEIAFFSSMNRRWERQASVAEDALGSRLCIAHSGVKLMHQYRIYTFREDGHFSTVQRIECMDEKQAVQKAQQLVAAGMV
jgi:hypothetical protein